MTRHFVTLFLVSTLIFIVPHPSFAQLDIEKEQLARWQLNNAELLIDEGKYLEAIEFVSSAFKITQHHSTRRDALLKKALLLSMFLDEEKSAIAIYQQLHDEFPKQAELALYRQALLYLELEAHEQASKTIVAYKKSYPNGRYLFQLDALLKYIEKNKPVPVIVEKAKPVHAVVEKSEPVPAVVEKRKPAHTVVEKSKPVPPVVEKIVKIKQPTLRVALAKQTSKLVLDASKGSVLLNGKTKLASPSIITLKSGKLFLNGKRTAGNLTITSSRPITTTIKGRKKIVRGRIWVHPKQRGMLVLNIIGIEDYLLSVVPSESYPSWSNETLRAQAIASRTYAYYQKKHRKNLQYDVRADTFDQMYGGVAKEHSSTTKAIQATRGTIITVKKRPILAQYTANSGGHSADAGVIFNTSKPYLIAHADPKSLKGKLGSWKRSFTLKEIEKKIAQIGIRGKRLVSIVPYKTGPSGRVVTVKLNYTDKTHRLNTRTTLASSKVLNLPDILFEIKPKGNQVTFYGHGHGHGVGLSQWGSAELGKKYTAEQILAFYYPTTVLHQEWQ